MQEPKLISETGPWIAVFKPAGWLTIPGRILNGPSVLSTWVEKQLGARAWVTHRIDLETSGVVLFAKTAEAHREASLWFQEKKMKKTYDCLASGVPKLPIFRIDSSIEGAKSVSQVEARETYHEGFLARVRPLTGRRHQIRIHLAKQGHPLWGDPTYGGKKEILLGASPEASHACLVSRVALHAARLELPTREVFEAPWPEDFQSWVETLRKEGTRVP